MIYHMIKSPDFINPLRTIGSPVTHENWPMNWPNFAAWPALLGWPARNRHTAACIHRFSHLLRTPPVLVVWFMSESRAVANEHEGHKRTILIISSSFWMTVVLKGLIFILNSPDWFELVNYELAWPIEPVCCDQTPPSIPAPTPDAAADSVRPVSLSNFPP